MSLNQSSAAGSFHVDEAELSSRRAFFDITDEDLARASGLRSFADTYSKAIVEDFYKLLLTHPETKLFFADEAAVRRVKQVQTTYFSGLFGGKIDLDYVEQRLRVGAVHQRIGLAPKFYLGAYRRYLELILDYLARAIPDPVEVRASFASLQKLVLFDVSLAIDTYIHAHVEAIARQEAALRQLSTPVTRVYDQVLLLPLVGAIDDARAEQVMEAVLLDIVRAQARCVILDVAGVPVVDARVADHLLKTTAAARLLGAETILTGVTPRVATTMANLDVDTSSMHTVGQLSDGIALALRMLGKEIRDVRERP